MSCFIHRAGPRVGISDIPLLFVLLCSHSAVFLAHPAVGLLCVVTQDNRFVVVLANCRVRKAFSLTAFRRPVMAWQACKCCPSDDHRRNVSDDFRPDSLPSSLVVLAGLHHIHQRRPFVDWSHVQLLFPSTVVRNLCC